MAVAPPLRVVVAGVAVAVGFIALLALYRTLPGDRRDNTVAGQTQHFLGAPADAGKLRVIALGSSLLWAATPQPANLQRASMPDIEWLRMTKGGAGLGHLQASLEMIERYRPEVLVIDENMLLPDTGSMMDPLREEAWHFAKKAVAFLSAGKRTSPTPTYWEHNDQDLPFSCPSALVKLTEAQKRMHAVELQDVYRHAVFDSTLIARLAGLARSGVRVVLLDLRRSSSMEQETMQQKHQWRKHLETLLAPGNNIHYLASPTYRQQDLYCDGSHLNAAGARLFAPWLHTQLQLLQKVR